MDQQAQSKQWGSVGSVGISGASQPPVGATLRSTCRTHQSSWCVEEKVCTTTRTTCKHASSLKTTPGFFTHGSASQGTMQSPLLWIQGTSMFLEDHTHQRPAMSSTWAVTTGSKAQILPGMLSSSKPAPPPSTLRTS